MLGAAVGHCVGACVFEHARAPMRSPGRAGKCIIDGVWGMQSKVRNLFDLTWTPCRLQSHSDSAVWAQHREARATNFSLITSSFYLFFFSIKEILPKDPLFCYLSFSVIGKEGERMRREEVIVILWVITERLKIKLGNLLPINYIFMRHSYHQNWIYMQNDAACVGTGGLIAKHGQVSYANCAHFPTNLKWLSLHPYSYNALIT